MIVDLSDLEALENASSTLGLFPSSSGDVTLDPIHYEEAWTLSKGHCARAMRSLGYHHLYKHRPEEAIECFEKSISVNAMQIPVWYSIGCTSLMIDDPKRAEKAFLRCVHLDYDNYEAWTNLASAQVKLGFKVSQSLYL